MLSAEYSWLASNYYVYIDHGIYVLVYNHTIPVAGFVLTNSVVEGPTLSPETAATAT